MSLLALAGGPALFYLAALVFGAGFALGHTGLTLLAMDRAPASERGAAMATFSLAWDAGTLGTFALGFVADVISLQALFLAAAVLPAIALLVFASVTRKR
jgi:MFS family permease